MGKDEWIVVREGGKRPYLVRKTVNEPKKKSHRVALGPWITAGVGILAAAGIWLGQLNKPDDYRPELKRPTAVYNVGNEKDDLQVDSHDVTVEKETARQPSARNLEEITEDVWNNGTSLELDERDFTTLVQYLINEPQKVLEFMVDKWKNNHYSGSHKGSIEIGVRRSKNIVGFLKHTANKHRIPEDALIGLGMAESYFYSRKSAVQDATKGSATNKKMKMVNSKEESPAGAFGPMQLMAETAREYGLTVMFDSKNKKGKTLYDERSNVYLAADAAARKVANDYSAFKEWDTAYANYNSGKPGKFHMMLGGPKGLSYLDYLELLGSQGEALESRAGLAVPKKIQKKYQLEEWIGKQKGYILENLNYPPKMYAILQIIKHDYPDYYSAPAEESVTFEKFHNSPVVHTVKKGETLHTIAKKYSACIDQLREDNCVYDKRLRVGTKLNIKRTKDQSIHEMCGELSKKYKVTASQLRDYNNHIWNAAELPEEIKVVVPKHGITKYARQ
jgi:LysM repeat protein